MAVTLMSGFKRLTFPDKHILVDFPEYYEKVEELGHGAYSHVFKAVDSRCQSRPAVAIKRIRKAFDNELLSRRIYREINLLRYLSPHLNIVRLLKVYTTAAELENFKDIYLVMEYADIDLHRYLHRFRLPLDHEQKKFILYQILRGLKYIHHAGVIHRDLKPANIGLMENCTVKILDFGISREIADEGDKPTGYVQTRWYRAPDIYTNWSNYTDKIDLWSVGCIMAEMESPNHDILFKADNHFKLFNLFVEKMGKPNEATMKLYDDRNVRSYIQSRPTPPANQLIWSTFKPFLSGGVVSAEEQRYQEDFVDLLSNLLNYNFHERCSASQALSHSFFGYLHDPSDEPAPPRYRPELDLSTSSVKQIKEDLFLNIPSFPEILPDQLGTDEEEEEEEDEEDEMEEEDEEATENDKFCGL